MARRTFSIEVKEGILRDLAAGVSPAEVAKTYGISIPTAYNYKNRAAVTQTVTAAAPAEVASVNLAFATLPAARKNAKAAR